MSENIFFPKRSRGLIESSFDKRSELFLLKVRKWQNRSLSLRKKFLKIIFWSRIMQFRERSRKSLPFSERFSLKVWKRIFFFQKKTLFSKCSPGLFQRQFGHPTKIFLPKVQEMFDPIPKNMEKNFRKKSFFSQNDPQRSKKAVLTNAPNCFCQKSEID